MKYVVAILFFVFAIVQYNDPDPYVWIGLYTYIGLHILFHERDGYPTWISKLTIIVLVGALACYTPDLVNWIKKGSPSITQKMKADSPHVELVREGLGLMLCLLAIVFFNKKEKNLK